MAVDLLAGHNRHQTVLVMVKNYHNGYNSHEYDIEDDDNDGHGLVNDGQDHYDDDDEYCYGDYFAFSVELPDLVAVAIMIAMMFIMVMVIMNIMTTMIMTMIIIMIMNTLLFVLSFLILLLWLHLRIEFNISELCST